MDIPLRNASWCSFHVLSSSGEFAPTVVDLRLPSFGPEAVCSRSYRSSRAGLVGPFGRGWSASWAQILVGGEASSVRLLDGAGRTHTFLPASTPTRTRTDPKTAAVLHP